jgi:hypothetical protein
MFWRILMLSISATSSPRSVVVWIKIYPVTNNEDAEGE